MGNPDRSNSLGLCARCMHAQEVPHPRGGGTYSMCGLSETDDSYDRYPRLPVMTCAGFDGKTDTSLPSP